MLRSLQGSCKAHPPPRCASPIYLRFPDSSLRRSALTLCHRLSSRIRPPLKAARALRRQHQRSECQAERERAQSGRRLPCDSEPHAEHSLRDSLDDAEISRAPASHLIHRSQPFLAPLSTMSAASSSSALSSALFRALLSSQTQNQMVEFARYAQLATIGLDGSPAVRTIHVRAIEEVPSSHDGQHTRGAIKFSTDSRSAKMQEFAAAASAAKGDAGAVAELVWFFPVTREQFRLKCNVQCIVSEGENTAAPAAADATAAASSAAAPAAPLPASLLRSSPADLALHSAFWRAHSQESRLLFELAPPGTPKRRTKEGDLDRYAPQEVSDNPGRHFVTVLLLPFKADYLKLPRPSEDTRGQIQRVQHHQHESLAQPNRGQSRWMHTRDPQTGAWTAVELNP